MAFMALSLVPAAHAYGRENWQVGLAGTGVLPGSGFGFGFWGWCAFAGVSSGAGPGAADCVISNYIHSSSFSLTCTLKLDITGWAAEPGLFPSDFVFLSGTISSSPASAFVPCLTVAGLPPGAVDLTTGAILVPLDPGIPAKAGHYNLGTFGPLKGEFQIQVTQLP